VFNARLTVRSRLSRGIRAIMSKLVRAGLVTGISWCSVTSSSVRIVERWTQMPLRRRLPLISVTSNGSRQLRQNPQCVIADDWLRYAC
jgi:hypothetical protein